MAVRYSHLTRHDICGLKPEAKFGEPGRFIQTCPSKVQEAENAAA